MSDNNEPFYNDPLVRGFLGAAGLGSAYLLSRPGVRANLSSMVRNIGRGGAAGQELRTIEKGLPGEVVEQAQHIAQHLKDQGVDLAQARIGIAGVGGTGKSTLGRALSEHGVGFHDLDDVVSSSYRKMGRNWDKWKQAPIPQGSLAQSHILTNVDPDELDAIIQIRKPVEKVKQQLQSRGRGAYQTDFYDYGKIQGTTEQVFKHTRGDELELAPGVFVKTKPSEGFQLGEGLDKALADLGINTKGMDQQQKLVSAYTGSKTRGPGITPFIRKDVPAALVGSAGVGAALGTYSAPDTDKVAYVDTFAKLALQGANEIESVEMEDPAFESIRESVIRMPGPQRRPRKFQGMTPTPTEKSKPIQQFQATQRVGATERPLKIEGIN